MFTISKLEMWVQHFWAFVRGDFTNIVGKFEKAASDLAAHNKYLTLIADNQAQASRALANSSKALYAEADKAKQVAANIGAIINPPAS